MNVTELGAADLVWLRVAAEFGQYHRVPLNVAAHLLTTPLGVWGALVLVLAVAQVRFRIRRCGILRSQPGPSLCAPAQFNPTFATRPPPHARARPASPRAHALPAVHFAAQG